VRNAAVQIEKYLILKMMIVVSVGIAEEEAEEIEEEKGLLDKETWEKKVTVGDVVSMHILCPKRRGARNAGRLKMGDRHHLDQNPELTGVLEKVIEYCVPSVKNI